MAFYLPGVHVPHRKNTANMSAVKMNTPKTVVIPMSMHIGAPATPVVKVGDHVDIGTLIGEQNGVVSSPVYSSVSGTVKKIDDFLLSQGENSQAIVIESDGENTVSDTVKAPVVNTREDFIEAVKQSGIVGLGGAGFPTYVKFGLGEKLDIDQLIINGAECEPYITSDSVTMVNDVDDIKYALETMIKLLEIKEVIIGIEKNKPQAIDAMKKIVESNDKISVKILPSLYPQGGEKVLVYHTTGKVIETGKLPIDVGCVVCNSTTVATIGKYLKTGMPLVEKVVTVDGGAVAEPKNVIAPIGTAMSDVFEFCGGFKSEPDRVVYGGPMMGVAVPDTDAPILKNTNAILALTAKETKAPKQTACINCGKCANVCPFGIDPRAIAKAYKGKDAEALEKAGVETCMLCGCCSFTCPASRMIVQNNKLAKDFLKDEKQKEANK